MNNGLILFHNEGIRYLLRDKKKIRDWIQKTILSEKKELGHINYIFADDEYLHDLNVRFLKHYTLTDIITFDNSEDDSEISGDIFISIERVKENSKIFNTSFIKELHRVLIHGVLHLIGYADKSKEQAIIMRQKEDYYLSLTPHLF